jgi:hypothetical protein
MPTDLEARIDALESRAAIDELRSRYAWHAMRGDAAGVASLFTEDCVFDGPAGPGIIEVNGDRATGSCVMETPMAPDFGHLVGDYVEEFARIDGKWYFAVRRMYLRVPYREEYPD